MRSCNSSKSERSRSRTMHRPRDASRGTSVPCHMPQFSLLSAAAPLLMLSAPLLLALFPPAGAEAFNFEIGLRVRERLGDYMGDPATVARLIAEYRDNGLFAHDMDAPDRDQYLKVNKAMMQVFPHFEAVYYGLENGAFAGHGFAKGIANYREPGESGYAIDDANMEKHYRSCVGKDGAEEDCTMAPGGSYIECVDGCSLDRCPDEESQRDCSALASDEGSVLDFMLAQNSCEKNIKWCKTYVRRTAPDEGEGPQLGFIPRMTSCIDETGVLSQTPGAIVKKGTDKLGNCYFQDGVTLVNRTLAGDYAYCGGNGEICDDTFVGMYLHRDYDPRWRGWYEDTKAQQKSNWSPPYPFFTNLAMGITYSVPIYSMQDEKNVFMGVVAVDYTLENITQFLLENYLNTSTAVAIFEEAEPNYMIGSSTGSKAARQVLKSDETTPCQDVNSGDCAAVRVKISDFSAQPMDAVLSRAFAKQKEANFPTAELVSVKSDDSFKSAVYVSQTQLFEFPDAHLKWRILIVRPMELSSSDTILVGDHLFGFIVAIGALGFAICLFLFYRFFRRRESWAVVISDWRFTSAFIWGCTLLNTATFSFLGPNTNALCMLRMWMCHFFFALALSPLLVKIYRMMKLVGFQGFQRIRISHKKAAMYTLPIILAQVIILTVFSFVDPSKQSQVIEMNGADYTHRIICSHNTNAFFIVEMAFEGGLVLLGCALAFKTRRLKSEFGEAKQLIFAMYNIAVVGTVVVIVTNVMGGDQAGKRLLYAIGIFWGTCFGCAVFVVPRLIRARKDSIARQAPAATAAAAHHVTSKYGVSGHHVNSTGRQTNNSSPLHASQESGTMETSRGSVAAPETDTKATSTA